MALLLATTPPGLNKNLLVCQRMTDYETQPPSKPIVKLQQTAQHMANKLKNYTQRKSNMHKLSNQNAEKSSLITTFNVQNVQYSFNLPLK